MPTATLVTLAGEIDIATAPHMSEHLLALPDRTAVVDMSEVSLLSAVGLRVLLDLQDHLAPVGAQVVLANSRSCVRRVLAVTGLDARFVMASTVADAFELVTSELTPMGRPARLRALPTGGACRTARHSYRSVR